MQPDDKTMEPTLAGKAYLACLGSAVSALTIGQVNQYLQAAAFVVAIISGLCAARYYWKKTRNDSE